MIETTSPSTRRRRARWPIVAALTALTTGALTFAIATAGGSPGSAPKAAPSSPDLVGPVGVPSVEQAGSVVDAGWVAPTSQGAAKAPAVGGRADRGSRGGITITRIDGPRLSLETVDGWTRTIDATGAAITRDGATIGPGDLAVGDAIVLRQKRQADGAFKITAIRVILPKVAGTVAEVSASSLTLAARDGTKVTVKLVPSTTYRLGKNRAEKSVVKVGMQAVAIGTKGADGALTATSITVAASRIAGRVTATSGTTITVTTRNGSTVTVSVGSSTTYRVAGVKRATLKDVKVDMLIVAQGVRNDDGSFAASVVRAAATGKHLGWGDWKPNRGGPEKASPAPAGTQRPSSNG